MNNLTNKLFQLICELVNDDPVYRRQFKALSGACLAAIDELEHHCGKEMIPLLDAVTSLKAQEQEAYDKCLFRSALCLGMELGRLSVS